MAEIFWEPMGVPLLTDVQQETKDKDVEPPSQKIDNKEFSLFPEKNYIYKNVYKYYNECL